MTDTPVDRIADRIRAVYRSWGRDTSPARMRADWDTLLAGDPAPADEKPVDAGGVPARWIAAPGAATGKTFLYFHGGGFQVGSVASHRGLIARISAASGARGLGIDYRLVPEHRFPAQLDDALTVYRWALDQGIAPEDIALVGDSAGGGLVVSLMLAAREAGLPLPAAAVLLSPWTDMTASGESFETRAAVDPIHQRPMLQAMARAYLGREGDPLNPLASPVFADLTGLPPLLIQVGDRETVLDDARVLAERARAADVEAILEVEGGMIHVFQLYAEELPEARAAIDRIGAFIKSRVARRV